MCLPKGWEIMTLGDVCRTPQYGWTTRAVEIGDLHLLRTTDITSGQITWEKVPFCAHEPSDKDKYLVQDGDIVISRAGSVGFSHLIKNPKPAVFASYLIRFRPLINQKYVAYYLQSPAYWQAISESSIGIAIPNVNATKLKRIPIPVAPIPEQELIVAKIEELFSQLEAGVAALKRVQAGLKRYRQSVLKAAFEGRLVPQDPEDEPADEILRKTGKIPLKVNGNKTLPKGWTWTSIIDVIQPSRNRVNPQNYPSLPFIGMEHIESQTMRLLGTIPSRFMKSTAESFHSGDILYGRLRPYLNKVYCPDFDGLCSTEFIIFPKVENIYNKYLQYFLNTSDFVRYSTSLNSGDRPRVKFEQFSTYPIPLPPLPEQKRISLEIEKRLSVIEALEKYISSMHQRASILNQSILKHAFEGRLVPLIPNGEPDEVQRIETKDSGKSRKNSTHIEARLF